MRMKSSTKITLAVIGIAIVGSGIYSMMNDKTAVQDIIKPSTSTYKSAKTLSVYSNGKVIKTYRGSIAVDDSKDGRIQLYTKDKTINIYNATIISEEKGE